MTTHNIYVIELDKKVLEKKKFKDANPDYIEGSPCVYVGMTSKSPEERFKQHKEGHKASRIVKIIVFISLVENMAEEAGSSVTFYCRILWLTAVIEPPKTPKV